MNTIALNGCIQELSRLISCIKKGAPFQRRYFKYLVIKIEVYFSNLNMIRVVTSKNSAEKFDESFNIRLNTLEELQKRERP